MLSALGLLLVAILLSNILYGTYVSVAIECIRMAVRKYRGTGNINIILLICFLLITLIATAKIILDDVLIVRAFTNLTPDGRVSYPSLDSPPIITLNVLWVLQTIIADSFIAYRVYVVWWPNYRVGVPPALLSLACIGVGGYFFWIVAGDHSDLDTPAYAVRTFNGLKVFISTTLALNIICSGLIALRVWSIHWRMDLISVSDSTGRDPVKKAVAIIVESALIYTIILTLDLVFLTSESSLSHLVTPTISQVMAIAFGWIIVRSAQGRSVDNVTYRTNGTDVSQTMPRFASRRSSTIPGADIPVALDRITVGQMDDSDHSSSPTIKQ